VADTSLRTIKNAYGGANQKNRDLFNMNIDQDYKPDLEGDIALAKEGYMSKDGKQRLIEKQGIEVGNIFQLGYHYSRLMRDASFIDKDGKAKPYYMGCYGIGIGRTMAALVEKYHDEKGIMWPLAVAPFRVHLISIGKEQTDKDKAEKLYKELCDRNIDVLFDDRDISPGEKFADADLVGIPIRLVISPKTGDKAEYKERNKKEIKIVTINELFNSLTR